MKKAADAWTAGQLCDFEQWAMTDLARGHQNTHWISIYRVNTQLLEKIKAKDACNQK